jgi:hypothetical protein
MSYPFQGANILGLGRRNLVKVSVDLSCRINLVKLRDHLEVTRPHPFRKFF